ncbi:MAG: hypothetical protein WC374_10390 [Phycisphaerae bacterium]|jgi:hypothetical protein
MTLTVDMKMPDLRAAAKEQYGLTFPVGVSKVDIISACELAEKRKEAKAVTPAPKYEKPELTQKDEVLYGGELGGGMSAEPKAQTPPAPMLNNSDAIALYAAQMAKEAMEKLGKMEQAAKGKKSGKSDADIEKAGKDDAAIIAHMEKVEILIPWYPNAPREFTSCVNGYVCVIPVGKKKRVPLACYEDFMQQLKKKQKNADKFAAAEKKFLNS